MESLEEADDPGFLQSLEGSQGDQDDADAEENDDDLTELVQKLQVRCDELEQEKNGIEDMLVWEQLEHNKDVTEMGAEIATLRRSLADCETNILSLELQVDGLHLDGKEGDATGESEEDLRKSVDKTTMTGEEERLSMFERDCVAQYGHGLSEECDRLRTELARSEAARFELHRQLDESKKFRTGSEEDGALRERHILMMARMGEADLQAARSSEDGSRVADEMEETLRSYEDKIGEGSDGWPELWIGGGSVTPNTPKDVYGRVQALLELGEASLNDEGPEEGARLKEKLDKVEEEERKWRETVQTVEAVVMEREERIAMLEEALKEEKAKARMDAEDLAQQMTELRFELTEIVDEEKWRRSQAEELGVRRVKELETELKVAKDERTLAMAEKREAEEMMERREASRIEAESKVGLLEARLKEGWDQAKMADEKARVLEELLKNKDEIKGWDIVEVKLAREKLAREKAEAESKLAMALDDCEALRASVREVCAQRDRMTSEASQLQRSLDDSAATTAKLAARMERLEEELVELREKEEGKGRMEKEWERETERREREREEMEERVKEMEGVGERAKCAEGQLEELAREIDERDQNLAALKYDLIELRKQMEEENSRLQRELEVMTEEKSNVDEELSMVSERLKVLEDVVRERGGGEEGMSTTMSEVLRKWQKEVLENQKMAKEVSEMEKVCRGMKEEKTMATRMLAKVLETVCKDLSTLIKLSGDGEAVTKGDITDGLLGRAQRLGSSFAVQKAGGEVKVDLSKAMAELVDVVGLAVAATKKELTETRIAVREKGEEVLASRCAMESELSKTKGDLEGQIREERATFAKSAEKMIDRVAGEMVQLMRVMVEVKATAGSKIEMPESLEERIGRITGSALREPPCEGKACVFGGWFSDFLMEFADVAVKIGVLTRKQLTNLLDQVEDLRDQINRLHLDAKSSRDEEISLQKAVGEDLKAKLLFAEEKMAVVREERDRVREEVKKFQLLVEEQRRQHQQCQENLKDLTRSNDEKQVMELNMADEIARLKANVAVHQSDLSEAREMLQQMEQVKMERDCAVDSVMEIKRVVKRTRETITELENEVQRRVPREELEAKKEEVMAMAEKAAMVEGRWKLARDLVCELEEEVRRLKDKVEREKGLAETQQAQHRKELRSQKQMQLFFSRQLAKLEGVEMEKERCVQRISELKENKAKIERERDECRAAYSKLELKVHKRMGGWRGS